jgi:hypothetical protein
MKTIIIILLVAITTICYSQDVVKFPLPDSLGCQREAHVQRATETYVKNPMSWDYINLYIDVKWTNTSVVGNDTTVYDIPVTETYSPSLGDVEELNDIGFTNNRILNLRNAFKNALNTLQ